MDGNQREGASQALTLFDVPAPHAEEELKRVVELYKSGKGCHDSMQRLASEILAKRKVLKGE